VRRIQLLGSILHNKGILQRIQLWGAYCRGYSYREHTVEDTALGSILHSKGILQTHIAPGEHPSCMQLWQEHTA